jgi:beta-phosphoglucomutase-like phosphatase (HAD superfamily)
VAAVFETHAKTSFLFDLDGTLVDSVYQHVLAWRSALSAEGIDLSIWRIHRKIGMSGGLFTSMLLRETSYQIDPERIERLRHLHAAAFDRDSANIQLLPGARELLAYLNAHPVSHCRWKSGQVSTLRLSMHSDCCFQICGSGFGTANRTRLPMVTSERSSKVGRSTTVRALIDQTARLAACLEIIVHRFVEGDRRQSWRLTTTAGRTEGRRLGRGSWTFLLTQAD